MQLRNYLKLSSFPIEAIQIIPDNVKGDIQDSHYLSHGEGENLISILEHFHA